MLNVQKFRTFDELEKSIKSVFLKKAGDDRFHANSLLVSITKMYRNQQIYRYIASFRKHIDPTDHMKHGSFDNKYFFDFIKDGYSYQQCCLLRHLFWGNENGDASLFVIRTMLNKNRELLDQSKFKDFYKLTNPKDFELIKVYTDGFIAHKNLQASHNDSAKISFNYLADLTQTVLAAYRILESIFAKLPKLKLPKGVNFVRCWQYPIFQKTSYLNALKAHLNESDFGGIEIIAFEELTATDKKRLGIRIKA